MKISLIGPGLMPIPPSGWGAVEILIWDYCQELNKLGHDIQIVNTQNLNNAIKAVNDFNPDFAHLHYDCYWEILDYIKCPNKAATTHYSYLERLEMYGHYWSIMTGFLTRNFRIFCLSESIKQVYLKLGAQGKRLEVTPNGVNIESFIFKNECEKPNKSIFLAKIQHRKRQYLYQHLSSIDFVGNCDDHKFNQANKNYLGEWSKEELYKNLTNYSNLVLLSDGEADPLVTKEALAAGLGLVISEYSTANLDLSKPFISVITEDKINDLEYVEKVISENRKISNNMRQDIRNYAKEKFNWPLLVKDYIKLIEKYQ